MSSAGPRRCHAWACLLLAAVFGWPVVALGQSPDPLPASRDERRPAAALDGTDPAYVRWLEERSLLYQAGRQARAVSGSGAQWQHPYGEPQPREAVRHAS